MLHRRLAPVVIRRGGKIEPRLIELMAVFEMKPGKDGLTGQANDKPGPPFEFKAVDRDTFQFSRLILRFVRDKAGKVVGLECSNPLLRNVKFTRLSDR